MNDDMTEKGYEFNRAYITKKNRDEEPVTFTKYSLKKEREDKKR